MFRHHASIDWALLTNFQYVCFPHTESVAQFNFRSINSTDVYNIHSLYVITCKIKILLQDSLILGEGGKEGGGEHMSNLKKKYGKQPNNIKSYLDIADTLKLL